MTESEVLDILRQIGCRVSAAAFIIQASQPGDDIRHVLPTLIEDTAEDVQRLTLGYCAAPEALVVQDTASSEGLLPPI
jgi:hypothetical protein